jgi:hypothetical protein
VPRHVGRPVTLLVVPLVLDYSASRRLVVVYFAPLVVDFSASRRLVVDYFANAARLGASARRAARHAARCAARSRLLRLAQARRRLLRLRRTSGCLGLSRGLSRGLPRRSSSTSPPRAGLSSTTSPTPRVLVPRHIARLITRLVAPLVVDYSASRRLVVDYFAYAACPGALARRVARHTACRAARRRLLRLSRASGCLGTSHGSSRGSSRRSSPTTPPRPGSSSTTPPRVRVPRHVTRLVVDYSASPRLVVDYSTVRPDALARRAARHAARHAARRRLLHVAQARRRLLHRASGCLGTSRGSSGG